MAITHLHTFQYHSYTVIIRAQSSFGYRDDGTRPTYVAGNSLLTRVLGEEIGRRMRRNHIPDFVQDPEPMHALST